MLTIIHSRKYLLDSYSASGCTNEYYLFFCLCVFHFPDTEGLLGFQQTICCCHFSLEYKKADSQTQPSPVTPLLFYLELPSSAKQDLQLPHED